MSSLAVPTPMFPQLDAYIRQIVEKGAQPLPVVKLNTQLPSLGPCRLPGGFYDLVCTPGPLLQTKAVPGSGRLLGVA